MVDGLSFENMYQWFIKVKLKAKGVKKTINIVFCPAKNFEYVCQTDVVNQYDFKHIIG